MKVIIDQLLSGQIVLDAETREALIQRLEEQRPWRLCQFCGHEEATLEGLMEHVAIDCVGPNSK